MDNLNVSRANAMISRDPVGFKSMFAKGEFADTPQLEKLLNNADKQIQFNISQGISRARQEVDLFSSDVDLKLAQANEMETVNAIETDVLKSKDQFGEKRTNEMLLDVERKRNSLLKRQGSTNVGSVFAQGLFPVNPQIKEHRDAIDNYYVSMVSNPQFQTMDLNQKNSLVADMINSSRFVPSTLKGEISRAAVSRNGEEVTAVADLIDRVEANSPHLINQLGSKENIERITMINDRINAGMGSNDAIATVDEILNPRNAATVAQVQEEIKKITTGIMGTSFRKKVINFFDPYFGGFEEAGPISSEAIDKASAVYRMAFEDNYRKSRNESDAKKSAERAMKKFGRSTINPEPILTEYPVERYYGIQGADNDWIRDQAVEDAITINKQRLDPISSEDIKDNLYIVADPIETQRTIETGLPVYRLMYIKDGVPMDLLNGQLFRPDETAARKKILKDELAEIEEDRLPADLRPSPLAK
jgi:hypothetical protein